MSSYNNDLRVEPARGALGAHVAFTFRGKPVFLTPRQQQQRKFVRANTKTKKALRDELKLAMELDGGEWHYGAAVHVVIRCFFNLPANWHGKGFYPGGLCLNNADVINLGLFYKDVVTGALIPDGNQVVRVTVEKRWAGGDRHPGPGVEVDVAVERTDMTLI